MVISKPVNKICKDTSSSKGMLGLIDKKCENLSQAAPRDFFSNCSNMRMSLQGEGVQDKGKNE